MATATTAHKPTSILSPLVRAVGLTALLLTVGACTRDLSSDSYSRGATGEVRRVERGTIESYRFVEIENTSTGVGTVAGAGVGAAAGSSIGDDEVAIIGAIGGAVIGGLIGSGVEKELTDTKGYEYIIRTESGNLVTLVQADKTPLPRGTPVIILFSRDRSRVIVDESAFNQQPGPVQQNQQPSSGR